ncbi:carboxypeptidase-like regulatory domain-containing protein [Bizionia paragorgiae]|uniref:CarboxypepD_reg-like domain-containing protein n=1 Tax=Bizionia paragorgiae TaxID=283786 RepID=A0A1H4DCG7_BIZPA|nr:carboxypeptidase-like regulatory domain-containing protein [Bizionia paragorgiae]SEA70523.1 CarboxypepD_reg-like domain-containing protein [Bizionia paragorgiae]
MKTTISTSVLSLLFFAFSLTAFSQQELKNKIVDFMTLEPLESASVYIQNTTIGTVSNSDGKFVLLVPQAHINDTLVVSSIGYKSYKMPIALFDNTKEVYLEEDIASLEEVQLVTTPRPKTGNDIVLRALKELPENLPENPYMQKGFLRHKERNKKEFKWLIESAITLYDSSFQSPAAKNLKINVDQVRKSYDLRDIDSTLTYTAYLKDKNPRLNLRNKNLRRDTIKTANLIKAIKWNDTRINGLENLFKGKLNIVRNSNTSEGLFSEDILETHHFVLDTILVDDGRKIYKIKIDEGRELIDLKTKGIYNGGYRAEGWLYVYYDTYAIKRIEYNLVAKSPAQKSRSKTLFGTTVNHKLVINYIEYQDRMYPNFVSYETPKLVNVGTKAKARAQANANSKNQQEMEPNNDERFYYAVQELLFSEIILEEGKIAEALNKPWDADIFAVKPYNKTFWESYNTFLESEEDEKLIQDLTKRSTLFKD